MTATVAGVGIVNRELSIKHVKDLSSVYCKIYKKVSNILNMVLRPRYVN